MWARDHRPTASDTGGSVLALHSPGCTVARATAHRVTPSGKERTRPRATRASQNNQPSGASTPPMIVPTTTHHYNGAEGLAARPAPESSRMDLACYTSVSCLAHKSSLGSPRRLPRNRNQMRSKRAMDNLSGVAGKAAKPLCCLANAGCLGALAPVAVWMHLSEQMRRRIGTFGLQTCRVPLYTNPEMCVSSGSKPTLPIAP